MVSVAIERHAVHLTPPASAPGISSLLLRNRKQRLCACWHPGASSVCVNHRDRAGQRGGDWRHSLCSDDCMDNTCSRQRFADHARSCCACHNVLALYLFLHPFEPYALSRDVPFDSVASAERSEPFVTPPSFETPPSAAPASSVESLSVESDLLKVSTRPSLTYEGGAVRTTIRVGRDWRNRILRLSIDGARFGASSEFWLEGADAAIVHERLWPTLPGGVYEVRVTVERNDGSTRMASTRFQVIGRESTAIALEGQSPVESGPGPVGRGPVTTVTPN